MTLSDTYKISVSRLVPLYGERESESIVSRLFEDKYGMGQLKRVLNFSLHFDRDLEFMADIKRLEAWEPVQYVTGNEEFYGRSFEVTSDTLIPRGETEQMVRDVLTSVTTTSKKILDIGTGSGVIAVTLACECPDADIEAWDVSQGALAVARRNAEVLGMGDRVRFVECDVLEWTEIDELFDIVVSNPPYVLDSERLEMRPNVVNYEPECALYVSDDDPLLFYRVIAQLPLLRKGGELWFEINERYAAEIGTILLNCNYSKVRVIKDIHGRDRILKAVYL